MIAQEVAVSSPWWFVAITGPLAALVALIVRWFMARQDQQWTQSQARDEEARRDHATREDRREAREERRVEQLTAQTAAMQGCVSELRTLASQHEAISRAISEIPERVVERQKRTG